MKGRIVFVKYGSFSLVNAKVEEILRQRFPEFNLTVYDVARDILAAFPLESAWLRFFASTREFRAFIKGRHSPWDFVFRHVRAWRLIGDWISKNIAPNETAFIFQTQGMFDASRSGCPFFIYTDHTREAHRRQPGGGAPAPVGLGWETCERSLYRHADTIFTLSQFCSQSLVEDYKIPQEKVLSVSTGINIDLPEQLPRRTETKPVILFVGVEWDIKGGPELLAAFSLVREKVPDSELWVVGCQPSFLPEGVRCFGRIGPAEMTKMFSQARLLCVPSRIERASMVALDAAAHGLPVICTPHGAGAERLIDGVTGFLVEPDNASKLSEKIIQLLLDADLAERMGSAGRKMVEEAFTWEAVGKKMEKKIRGVLEFRP